MSKLIITHAGEDIREMPVVIPGFKELPFFERVTAKEKFLKLKVDQFKMDNVTALIRLGIDYEIHLQI